MINFDINFHDKEHRVIYVGLIFICLLCLNKNICSWEIYRIEAH